MSRRALILAGILSLLTAPRVLSAREQEARGYDDEIRDALDRGVTDRMTRIHLADAVIRIEEALGA